MKINFASILGFAVCACLLPAAENAPTFSNYLGEPDESHSLNRSATEPKLDPKRIINESNNFLKEREPLMTAEEYAIYEKISAMLSTKPALALKLLEAMMDEKEQPSPAFECILGNVYYAAGQFDQAEARYRNAIKRFPSFQRVWNNLGVLYYARGKYSEAAPYFSKAIALGDREPATYGLHGYCLEKTGNVISAELGYMQALSSDAANTNWLDGLLRIYLQTKQYARAEVLVKSLLKDHPKEPKYWLTYAEILVDTQQKPEAIALLERTVALGIAGPQEFGTLADLYVEQKLHPEALLIYKKILADDPKQGEQKLLQFAQMLISDRKWSQALDTLETVRPTLSQSGNISYLQTKSDWFAAQKKWPEARQELEVLLKLAPLNGDALLGLGRAYAAEGNLPHATLALEAASQISTSAYQASLELANIELKNRHYEKSASHIERALSIERSSTMEDYLIRIKILADKSGQPSS